MSDIEGRPLISTDDDASETPKSQSGCLGKICKFCIWIFLICFIITKFNSCGKSDTEAKPQQQAQPSVQAEISGQTQEEKPADELDNTQDTTDGAIELSAKATSVEKQYFHKTYTDLGTVEIHYFKDRAKLLEESVNLLEQAAQGNFYSLKHEAKLFNKGYYYITSDIPDFYYVGEIKDNRPHGMGIIFGFSEESETYAEISEKFLIYYMGNFKNGMFDGYGALFSTDNEFKYTIVSDVFLGENPTLPQETCEFIFDYLLNYVSYEGKFDENKRSGIGNTFNISEVFDVLNDPIEGYPYYNVYPDVTVGTYRNDELNGDTRIYEHNHLSYSGEVKNGEENGYGTWYYENGQAEYEGEIKNGKPNGKGSRYGEDGQLIYSGEWKNGDYAH